MIVCVCHFRKVIDHLSLLDKSFLTHDDDMIASYWYCSFPHGVDHDIGLREQVRPCVHRRVIRTRT